MKKKEKFFKKNLKNKFIQKMKLTKNLTKKINKKN